MCNSRRRNAFTLIEVLIVVIIMAVLAATIIPQFTTSTKDAKESSLKFNMHTLRSQIELYKAQHNGKYPATIDATSGLPQLTSRTNAAGDVGTDATSYPFGPYVDQIPANPMDSKATVTSVDLSGAKPTAVSGTTGGWQYDSKTGAIWPNDADGIKTL
jgi:prepilin-type N-terminal cleavage/methylation domain-containing protein